MVRFERRFHWEANRPPFIEVLDKVHVGDGVRLGQVREEEDMLPNNFELVHGVDFLFPDHPLVVMDFQDLVNEPGKNAVFLGQMHHYLTQVEQDPVMSAKFVSWFCNCCNVRRVVFVQYVSPHRSKCRADRFIEDPDFVTSRVMVSKQLHVTKFVTSRHSGMVYHCRRAIPIVTRTLEMFCSSCHRIHVTDLDYVRYNVFGEAVGHNCSSDLLNMPKVVAEAWANEVDGDGDDGDADVVDGGWGAEGD